MRLGRFFKRPVLRRLLLRVVLPGLAVVAVLLLLFLVVAARAQPDFRPIQETMSAEHEALINQIPKYRRAEEATYLSFPEWYLVFNPQEYAESLRERPPSQFPYFKSIGQIWRGYAQVYGISRRHYPFNAGQNLMVMVIGTSSTVEYALKGAYENTIGRLFEWIGSGTPTAEESYAADVAKEYGDFIPTQPWYDFPFGRKFTGLWSKTGVFGSGFLRKSERKFFLSLEYGVKFLYAGVIRLATHSVYGIADTMVYASVTNIPDPVFENPNVKKIKQLGEHSWIITLPHYQGFTDTVPGLARQGVEFIEIAGNDEILITVVAPAAWKYDLADGRPLFTMELLTGLEFKRVAIQAPVKSLGKMLREIEAKGLRVEHLFDY